MFAGVTSSSRATCPNTETRRGHTSVIRKKNVAGYGLEPLDARVRVRVRVRARAAGWYDGTCRRTVAATIRD